MRENIITADFHGGVRTDSLVWHLAKEVRPDVPLCGMSLSGNFRRSKGGVTCGRCLNYAQLNRLGPHDIACLLALHGKRPLPKIRDKWYSIHALLEADLVLETKTEQRTTHRLTERGKLAAEDYLEPPPWRDAAGLVHLRSGWDLASRCAVVKIQPPDGIVILTMIAEIHERARKIKHAPNCLRCAVM